MASSKRAQKSSIDNASKNFDKSFDSYDEKKKAIREKYKDRGTSGKEQMKKELLALENKWDKQSKKRVSKGIEDDKNIRKYGKDAMKGRGFAQYSKGGMAKKSGYNKGGMVSCGASNPPAQKRSKK